MRFSALCERRKSVQIACTDRASLGRVCFWPLQPWLDARPGLSTDGGSPSQSAVAAHSSGLWYAVRSLRHTDSWLACNMQVGANSM